MKYLSMFALLLAGCHSMNPTEKALPGDKGIILSCIGCGCMVTVLEQYDKKNRIKDIPIYADTNCLQKSSLKNFIHYSQSTLDSLYEENYNIILFKKYPNKIEYRVILVQEHPLFYKIVQEFFREKKYSPNVHFQTRAF